ncbi:MAG: phosphoribosylglycinamide formyltransferase, partial [Dongiaceae bacterium]
MARLRAAVLISGRGSNMQALHQATLAPDFPAEIALIISNQGNAAGLDYAAEHKIPAVVMDDPAFKKRAAFDAKLDEILQKTGIEFICLAGFMRLLSHEFVEKWHDKIINIHPSLLPAFKGVEAPAQAFAAGVKIAGCTVHFVRSEMDAGPIIMQASCPVLPNDTVDTLAARILKLEHEIYPKALAAIAAGKVKVIDN